MKNKGFNSKEEKIYGPTFGSRIMNISMAIHDGLCPLNKLLWSEGEYAETEKETFVRMEDIRLVDSPYQINKTFFIFKKSFK